MKLLIFLLSSLMCFAAKAQQGLSLDSLRAEILRFKANKEFDKALAYSKFTLERLKREYPKQDSLYASFLVEEAAVLFLAGKYPESLKAYQTSLSMAKTGAQYDNKPYAWSLSGLASCYLQFGKNDSAQLFFAQAMSFYDKNMNKKNDEKYIILLRNYSVFYERQKKYDQAIEMYQKVFKQLEEDRTDLYGKPYFAAQTGLINVHILSGKFENGETLLAKAIAESKKELGDTSFTHLNFYNLLAKLYQKKGSYAKMQTLVLEQMEVCRQLGQYFIYQDYFDLLFQHYYLFGQYDDAEALALKQLAVYQMDETKHLRYMASVLLALGNVYLKQLRFQDADKQYNAVMNIYNKIGMGKSKFYYLALHNTALVNKHLGAYPKAKEVYKECIAYFKQDTSAQAQESYYQMVNNLASLYLETKEFKEAFPLLMETLKGREKLLGKSHPRYAESLGNLARYYGETKEYDKAIEYIDQLEAVYAQSLPVHSLERLEGINTRLQIYYEEVKNHDLALEYIFKALANNARQDSVPREMDQAWKEKMLSYDYVRPVSAHLPLKILELILSRRGEDQKAYWVNQFGLALYRDQHTKYVDEADKLNSMRINNYWSRRFLTHKDQKGLDQALFLEHAFEATELNKGLLLGSTLQSKANFHLGGLSDSIYQVKVGYEKQITSLKGLLAQTTNDSLKQVNLAKIRQTTLKLDSLKLYIEQKYPKYAAGSKYQTAKIKDVQASLNEQTVLLEYVLNDSMLYVFQIDRQTAKLHAFPYSQKEFRKQAAALRKSLSEYDYLLDKQEEAYKTYTQSAYWLHQLLIAPLDLKGKTKLLIIPDAELHHLPFGVFLKEDLSTRKTAYKEMPYLIKDFAIFYNYSSSLYQESLKPKAKRHNGKLLAFAASYESDEQTVDSTVLLSRSPRLNLLRKTLSPLPAVQSEVKSLEALLSGQFFYQKQATEENFKRLASQYGVIHLAMHGILVKDNSLVSSLAFTENFSSKEDNFLHAFEITDMDLQADLIVLSACETGYGKFAQGEGVMSLARSFMYAGVPSMLVSMWQVNDVSTAQIMQYYYQNLQQGMDKALALQQAQITYILKTPIENDLAAHPAFWAPFVQLGNEQPLPFLKPTSPWVYAAGALAGLGLLGALAWAYRRRKNAVA